MMSWSDRKRSAWGLTVLCLRGIRSMTWVKKEPILGIIFLYLLLGYALYFAALSVEPSGLNLGWFEALKAYVKSIRTATRVAALRNESAFPAQIIIMYCAIGTVLVAAWAAWYSTGIQYRNRLIKDFSAGGYSRFRYAVVGIFLLVLPVFFLTIFFMDTKIISWRDHVLFSSSLKSASFLLVSSAIVGMGVGFVIPSIEFALKGPRAHKFDCLPE